MRAFFIMSSYKIALQAYAIDLFKQNILTHEDLGVLSVLCFDSLDFAMVDYHNLVNDSSSEQRLIRLTQNNIISYVKDVKLGGKCTYEITLNVVLGKAKLPQYEYLFNF